MKPFSADLANVIRIAGFYVALPVVLSLHSGIFQTGFGQFLPPRISIYFWASMWLVTWWLYEILLYALTAILRPWQLSLLVRILAAGVVGILTSRYYTPELLRLFSQFGTDVPLDTFIARSSVLDTAHLANLFGSGAPGLIAWAGSRLLYSYWCDNSELFRSKSSEMPHEEASDARSENAPSTSPKVIRPASTPRESAKLAAIISKIGIRDLSEVLALRAEDHYVRIVLRDRSELISYRFAEILDDFAQQDGLRVHRSHWISRAAVESVNQRGGSLAVKTISGQEVPVSMKYRAMFDHWYRTGHVETS